MGKIASLRCGMAAGGETFLDLREPPADGRAKYWGKPDTVKFYVPTGKPDDGPWTQDVCWKGALSREFQIAKNKKHDLEAGNDIEAIMRTKAFLRHEGASRDSQRTGLNTRQRPSNTREGSIHSVMPSRGPKSTARCDHPTMAVRRVGYLRSRLDVLHTWHTIMVATVSCLITASHIVAGLRQSRCCKGCLQITVSCKMSFKS